MKIKAADIARNLNLSKATVSLVLNNKPGVSEKTRRKVFDYIEEVTGEAERQKEEKNKQELENKNIIKVLFIDNDLRFLKDFELDVCPDSLTIFEQEARRMGCIISVTYASSTKKEDVERVGKCGRCDPVCNGDAAGSVSTVSGNPKANGDL